MKKSNVLKFIEQLKKDCKSNQVGLFLYDQKFIMDECHKIGLVGFAALHGDSPRTCY